MQAVTSGRIGCRGAENTGKASAAWGAGQQDAEIGCEAGRQEAGKDKGGGEQGPDEVHQKVLPVQQG